MGMEEAARQMAQDRSQAAAAVRQRNEDWAERAMADLAPAITEYARALVRVDVRSTQMNGRFWFSPRLVLIPAQRQDDVPGATCQFSVHASGEWSWSDRPRYLGDAVPEPVAEGSVRAELTRLLSWAIASAGRD